MTETYTFTNTLAGLRLMLHVALSLRANGFTTEGFLGEQVKMGTPGVHLVTLEATPAERTENPWKKLNRRLNNEAV